MSPPLKVHADKCMFELHDAVKRKTIDLSWAQLTFLLRFASREAGEAQSELMFTPALVLINNAIIRRDANDFTLFGS